ncbi:Helix-turn-helix domain protein [Caballeronia choica]|jgi:excisionase family DNA binding protein|uniref:Helix-turn-helix domain protein n=1 Tax=Caballeronia choica TaxID=326476 RepID=A0A158KML4_9BURK|nr:Helix-turn-helix domain protein [Caballeronia choica]
MTLPELARRLNVSRPYLLKLVARGDLRASRGPDGKVLFDDAEADAYIAATEERRAAAMREYMKVSQKQRR